MKKIFFIVTMGIAVVFLSCSNNEESSQNGEQIKNTYGIELVNNQKWEVNEEMMIHIENMESDIQSTSGEVDPNLEELGSKLDDHIGLLTSNCTMTGQAHDELHKWLLPFIELVSGLNEASTGELQEESFQLIKESMNEFNAYFK